MRNYLNDTVVNETSGNCTVPVILNAFNMTRNFFQCPQDKRWDNRSFSCIQGKDYLDLFFCYYDVKWSQIEFHIC